MKKWKVFIPIIMVLFIIGGVSAYFISDGNTVASVSNSAGNIQSNDVFDNSLGNQNWTEESPIENINTVHDFNGKANLVQNNTSNIKTNASSHNTNVKNNVPSQNINIKTNASSHNINDIKINTPSQIKNNDIGYEKSLEIAKANVLMNGSKFSYFIDDKDIRVFYFECNDQDHNGNILHETSIVVDKKDGRTEKG